jgi:hypothetical protein
MIANIADSNAPNHSGLASQSAASSSQIDEGILRSRASDVSRRRGLVEFGTNA